MTSNLLENQNEALLHLAKWKVGALFMEAGTGKTRTAMEIVNNSPASEVFWIGPLRTLHTIEVEAMKWGGFKVPVIYTGIESIGSSDRIFLELYNRILHSIEPFLIVDESLKIKNVEAKRTRRVLQLGSIAEYKLVLNGTPMSRDLLDMWSQMEFLSPKILGMSLSQFKNTFCRYITIKKQLGNVRSVREVITGYENIDYLYSLIRNYIYRCDLRLQIRQNWKNLPFSLSDYEKSLYAAIKKEYLSYDMMEKKSNNIFLEMVQKLQHSYCLAKNKFDVVDKIFQHEHMDKSIIFCKYVSSREECAKRYPDAMVLSYQTSAFGLNLQERNVTIYFDKIWDYAARIQSGRRTYRKGQEFDCRYYDLTGNVGLETLINRNIDKKISMTEYFKMTTKEDLLKDL